MVARMKRDDEAIRKAGSYEQAVDNGHRFGGRDAIPWQIFNGPDAVKAWFGQAVEAANTTIQKARGGKGTKTVAGVTTRVMSDKEVDRMVDNWVQAFNDDPALVRQQLATAADKNLPAKMETAFLIANRGMQDTYDFARRIDVGNYAPFASKEEASQALSFQLGAAIEMTASAKAMLAAAGRTLRRARGEFAARADAMAAVDAQALGAADPDALRAAILATGGDTAKMRKVGALGPSLLDYAAGLQAANLLWGWATHAINFATSMGNTVWRPLESYAGGGALAIKAATTGDASLKAQAATIRKQARREVTQIGAALYDSWRLAVQAFVRGDSSLTPHNIELLTDAAQQARVGTQDLTQLWRPVRSLEDVAANALNAANAGVMFPLRALGATDELVRQVRYRAVVMSKAMSDADDLGLKQGTKAYNDYIKDRVEKSFDSTGRATDANAVAEAKTSVFAQDLLQRGTEDTWSWSWRNWGVGQPSIGAVVQNAAAQHPFIRIIVPFVRTPQNLFRYGVKLTPGLNLLQKEYLNAFRGVHGVEAQARATGQMMLGISVMAIASYLRMNGQITGSGPTNGRAMREWRAEGNMPYSYTYTDSRGVKQSVQFNRFDPIQFPFALAADLVDMRMMGKITEDEEQSLAAAAVLAVTHQFRDKTYTKNIADFLEGLITDHKLEPNAQRVAQNFVPMSTLFKGINPDPYMREVHTWMDTFKATIPGFSDEIAPRYDAFGEKVKMPGRFFSEQTAAPPVAKAIDAMFANTGTVIMPMATRDSNMNKDLRDVILEDGRTAYDRLQELSRHPFPKGSKQPTMMQALEKVVNTTAFKTVGHGKGHEENTKEFMLMKVVTDYRRMAKERLQADSAMFREAMGKRAVEIFQAAKAGRKNAQAEGAKGAMQSLSPLLQRYGLDMPTQE
jgi:hypothetical protein